ncbi:MAG: DUF1893 domain-containing protein [Thermoplasmatales archaeon]|nr:MAG: DUF1893 domain-containing protein [Thermoplasmatales archaeon]
MIVNDEIIQDISLARKILSSEDYSIVVIRNEKILGHDKGDGIKPILRIINKLGEEIEGSVIGDRILGKASAFLCRYSKVSGVYSPQATKTAIAILIVGGIPCQADEMIPFITNRSGDGLCPFEKMLQDVESPEEAYKILKDKVIWD